MVRLCQSPRARGVLALSPDASGRAAHAATLPSVDERALTERLITYDTSQPDGIRACAGLHQGLAGVARDRRPRQRLRRAAGAHRRRRAAGRADDHLPRAPRRRPGPRGAVHAPDRGRPAVRPRRLRHEGQRRRDDVRAARPRRAGRRSACASSACPTRSPRTSTRARSTTSSAAGFSGDFAITGEPTDLHVGVQAKGVLAFRLHVHGRSAHGSTPWLGDNAVLKAIDVFRRIESLPFSRESSELFDRPSVNLGRIQGGDALNKVPDLCQMVVDIRFLPNQDPGDILEQIRSIPDIEVVKTFTRVPAYVSRSNPYVTALVAAVGRLTQGESMSVGRDGASDAVSFLEAGIPAVEFGPAGAGHHGPEEWVSISSLARYRQALCDFVLQLPASLAEPGRGAARRRGRAGVSRRRSCVARRGAAAPRPRAIWRTLLAGVLDLPRHRRRGLGHGAAAGRRGARRAAQGGPRADRDPRDRPRGRRRGADADDPRLRHPLRGPRGWASRRGRTRSCSSAWTRTRR